MERSLAHIEKVEWIKAIPGADKIELCGVLGWQCVTKKNEFKVGEKIIYVEVDSVMPEQPEFEFLRPRKFRVKSIKLRGELSQGLVLPILDTLGRPQESLEVGEDVTELLGITKYLSASEQEETKSSESKLRKSKNPVIRYMMRYKWFRDLMVPKKSNGWPDWISKTDEPRIQNEPRLLEQFKDSSIYVTEKVDFQSATFTGHFVPIFKFLGRYSPMKYQFVVCSRKIRNNDKDSLYWRIAKKYGIDYILKMNPTLTIQGEQGNTKVQGNKYGIKEEQLWVFNIIDHVNDYHFSWEEIKKFCADYGLEHVPELATNIKLSDLGSTPVEIVEKSNGKSVLADIPREGIVVRCIENGKKYFSFKAINPDFLLKYD